MVQQRSYKGLISGSIVRFHLQGFYRVVFGVFVGSWFGLRVSRFRV